jgi:hypothetical protein
MGFSVLARWVLRSVGLAALAMGCASAQGQSLLYAEGGNSGSSRGLLGDSSNTTFQITTPPMAAGTITHIRFTGRLSVSDPQTYANEACIEVTTPDGSKFVIQPFTMGSFVEATWTPEPGIAIAVGNGVGGTYTFRLFELYRDNPTGSDANWNNIFIGFWAGQPYDNTITPTTEGPSVAAGNWGTVTTSAPSPRSLAFSPPGPLAAGSVRVKGYGTGLTAWTTSASASAQSYVRINFTATSALTGGGVSWSVTPMPGVTFSSSEFDVTTPIPQAVLCDAGHPWTYTVTAPGTPTPVRPQIANIVFNVQPLQMAPPPATDLGFVRGKPLMGPAGTTVVATGSSTLTAGGVAWYKFTTEQACSNATGYWLDIHSRQPAGSAINDHEIAVYRPDSTLLATDDDSGAGHLSMLCFGQTSPVRPNIDADPSPVARAGQNGVLPAGTYYLALAEYNAQFLSPGFGATTIGNSSGSAAVDFRTNLPPAPPPAALDLGTLAVGLLDGGIHPASPNAIFWLRFALPQAVNNSNGRYLDVHTIGNASPAVIDTEVCLYDSVGVLLASDDDDGQNGNRSMMTFGGYVARPAISGSISRDGRDGSLAAGTYYLGVGLYNMTFNPGVEFGAVSDNAAAVQAIPVTIIYGVPCPADLGAQGGAAGHDGVLDNNDFVVFIDYFFNHNPLADVGRQGGVTPGDGAWDNNDFVVFIDQFFAGCL